MRQYPIKSKEDLRLQRNVYLTRYGIPYEPKKPEGFLDEDNNAAYEKAYAEFLVKWEPFAKRAKLVRKQLEIQNEAFIKMAKSSGVACIPSRDFQGAILYLLMCQRNNRMEHTIFKLCDVMDIRFGKSRFEDYKSISDIAPNLLIIQHDVAGEYNKEYGHALNELFIQQIHEQRQMWVVFYGTAGFFERFYKDTCEFCKDWKLPIIEITNEVEIPQNNEDLFRGI